MPITLITGAAGQDGMYLIEQLLADGAEVVALCKPGEQPDFGAATCDNKRLRVVHCDVLEEGALRALVCEVAPSRILHLASVSFVPASWEDPVTAARFGAIVTTELLEAARSLEPAPRVFLASSAEVFGFPGEIPQTESTPIAPINPYGASKAYGLALGAAYRKKHGLFVTSGILYNHESPRRPPSFVTRKVTQAAAQISLGLRQGLELGSLDARRDWGFAGDYARAMLLALDATEAHDYVIATGVLHSVEDFVDAAFRHVGLEWRDHVTTGEDLLRGADDSRVMLGDAT
jgi:GDPmannose 4,6-dehydratase